MTKITAAITAVGGYVPDYVLTNQELETMVDTNAEWIETRTGVKERRILKGEGLGSRFRDRRRPFARRPAGQDRAAPPAADQTPGDSPASERSEERRVGKECRSRWSPY